MYFLYLAVDHTQIKIIYTLLEIKKMYVACRMRRVDMLSVMGNWHVEIQHGNTCELVVWFSLARFL